MFALNRFSAMKSTKNINQLSGFNTNSTLIIPLIMVAANTILKGIFLGSNSIAGDEPFSIYIAQMDIPSIISQLSSGNNPPLYEILLHYWIKLFGISPLSVRFLSLIFSSVTVLFICLTGKKFINHRVGVVASIIFILSNYHTLFAHEARVYAMMGMLTVMSMFFYLKSISSESSRKKHWVFLLIINVLLIYSHYFGFFVLAVQLIHFVAHKKLIQKTWKPFLIVNVASLTAYIPNIKIVLHRFIDSSSNGTWIKAPDGLESLYNMLWSFSNAPVVAVISIAALVAALIKLIFTRKQHSYRKIIIHMIIIWFALPFFLMFFISFYIPMFLDRYLMVAAVGYPLLLAVSSDFILQKPGWLKYLIPCLICTLFLFTTKPNMSNKRNIRQTVEKITELTGKGDAIVYITPAFYDLNFIYYYDIEVFKNYNKYDMKATIHNYMHRHNIFPVDFANQIDTLYVSKFKKVIYLDAGADYSVPGNGMLHFFENRFLSSNSYNYYEIFKIYEFENQY